MNENYLKLCEPPVKKIHDCIHGFIYLSDFATRIIDNRFFERLRDLSQLGTCKYVFPNAIHTRFEHSLGTYHIASKLLEKLPQQVNQQIDQYLSSINELKRYYKMMYDDKIHPLDPYICELIKVAGLCHDIGHGPFSHVFDDVFLPMLGKQNDFCSTHEERSGVILKMIIKEDDVLRELINDDEINFMINLINPKKENTGFIYEIISNNQTGLDVDKFDYLQRDIYMLNFQAKIDVSALVEQVKIIDNRFVYPDQAINDVINLFTTRHRLHVQVYCHKVTISSQLMMMEIFSLMDEILGLSSSISDMNKFCDMTEGYILNSVKFLKRHESLLNEDQLKKYLLAKKLIDSLDLRKLYSMISHFVSKEKIDFNKYIESFEDKEKIIIFQNKVGFVSGNKPNPLDNIYVYKTKDSSTSRKLTAYKKNKEEATLLMPNIYQEYITIIFYKEKESLENKERISFLKTYFENLCQK